MEIIYWHIKICRFIEPRGGFYYGVNDDTLPARGCRAEMHRASKSAFTRGARFLPKNHTQCHLVGSLEKKKKNQWTTTYNPQPTPSSALESPTLYHEPPGLELGGWTSEFRGEMKEERRSFKLPERGCWVELSW